MLSGYAAGTASSVPLHPSIFHLDVQCIERLLVMQPLLLSMATMVAATT